MNSKTTKSQFTLFSEMNDISQLSLFDSLGFSPDSPVIRPMEDIDDIPELNLNDQDLDFEKQLPITKVQETVSKKLSKNTTIIRKIRKDSQNGVLD